MTFLDQLEPIKANLADRTRVVLARTRSDKQIFFATTHHETIGMWTWTLYLQNASRMTEHQANAIASMVDREEFDEVAIIGHINGEWTVQIVTTTMGSD